MEPQQPLPHEKTARAREALPIAGQSKEPARGWCPARCTGRSFRPRRAQGSEAAVRLMAAEVVGLGMGSPARAVRAGSRRIKAQKRRPCRAKHGPAPSHTSALRDTERPGERRLPRAQERLGTWLSKVVSLGLSSRPVKPGAPVRAARNDNKCCRVPSTGSCLRAQSIPCIRPLPRLNESSGLRKRAKSCCESIALSWGPVASERSPASPQPPDSRPAPRSLGLYAPAVWAAEPGQRAYADS